VGSLKVETELTYAHDMWIFVGYFSSDMWTLNLQYLWLY